MCGSGADGCRRLAGQGSRTRRSTRPPTKPGRRRSLLRRRVHRQGRRRRPRPHGCANRDWSSDRQRRNAPRRSDRCAYTKYSWPTLSDRAMLARRRPLSRHRCTLEATPRKPSSTANDAIRVLPERLTASTRPTNTASAFQVRRARRGDLCLGARRREWRKAAEAEQRSNAEAFCRCISQYVVGPHPHDLRRSCAGRQPAWSTLSVSGLPTPTTCQRFTRARSRVGLQRDSARALAGAARVSALLGSPVIACSLRLAPAPGSCLLAPSS